jgi:hypothetical protein
MVHAAGAAGIHGICIEIILTNGGTKMSNRNEEKIAGIVRNTLITKYGYEADGDYVRKSISENYGLGFFHDANNTLCICVYHREGAQFSPRQRSVIKDVLGRDEFTERYDDTEENKSTDGKFEIWAPLKIDAFDGYEDADIADWIVKLFEHFITTVNLLSLT